MIFIMKRRPKKPSQYLVKSEEGDEDGLLQTQAGEGPTASVPREEARPLPSARGAPPPSSLPT